MKFDFDLLSTLAKNDPEKFEVVKQEMLGEAIMNITEDEETRSRLRANLYNLNLTLDVKFKNPQARFNEVQRHFWSQVEKFSSELKNPQPVSKSSTLLKFTKTIEN